MLQPRPLASSQFPGSDFWVKYPFGGLVLKVPSWVFGGPTPNSCTIPLSHLTKTHRLLTPVSTAPFQDITFGIVFITQPCVREQMVQSSSGTQMQSSGTKKLTCCFYMVFQSAASAISSSGAQDSQDCDTRAQNASAQGQHSQGGGLPLGAVKYFFSKIEKRRNTTEQPRKWNDNINNAFRQCTL